MTDETRRSPAETSPHLMALSGKTMPIMRGDKLDLRVRRGEPVVIVNSIPWEMIADEWSERQSQRNHGQSLETIRQRGGFSACEAIAVISGQAWHALNGDESAHRILYAMHALFNRGCLFGRTAEQLSAYQRPDGER